MKPGGLWLFLVICGIGMSCLAEPATTRRVEIRLESVSCSAANDDPDENDPPRGEYFVHVDTQAEVGPIELKAGETSNFAPGMLLKAIDTGIVKEDREIVISIGFVLYVREDDTTQAGEDETDDYSKPIKIQARLVCPGSSTLLRTVVIPPRPDFGENEKPDRISLSLKIIAQ